MTVLDLHGHDGKGFGYNGLALTDADAPSLALALALSPQLTVVDLSTNKFAQALPLPAGGMPHLQSLELSNNQLTDAVAPALIAFIKGSPKLTTVTLSSNKFSGSYTSVSGACARMRAAGGPGRFVGRLKPNHGFPTFEGWSC